MGYLLHLVILFELYAVLALGQNILLGLGNLLFVAQAAAFGIGAYTSAILMINGVPGPIALALGAIAAVIVLVPIALPSLRLNGDYLFVASLAFCEVVRSTLNNTPSLTGGAQGLMAIPRLRVGPADFSGSAGHALLGAALLVSMIAVSRAVDHSPYGRLLRAVGEGGPRLTGEDAMRALGKPVRRIRLAAIGLAAVFAGLAGGIYASYMTYLDPTQFAVWESVSVLAMVVLGGVGTVRGAVTGTAIFILIPELLRFLSLPAAIAAPMRQVIFGVLLVLVLRFRPAGIFGRTEASWLRT